MFEGRGISCTLDRQTDRQTERRSVLHHAIVNRQSSIAFQRRCLAITPKCCRRRRLWPLEIYRTDRYNQLIANMTLSPPFPFPRASTQTDLLSTEPPWLLVIQSIVRQNIHDHVNHTLFCKKSH